MWLREKTKELVLCVWLLFWKDFVLYPRNPLSTKLWLRCTLGPEQIDFSTNIWGKTRATVEQVMLIKKKKKKMNSICECRLRCWEVFGRWANPWDNFLFMRGKNKLSKKLLTVSCYCFDSSWMCKKKRICANTLCNLLVCSVTFFLFIAPVLSGVTSPSQTTQQNTTYLEALNRPATVNLIWEESHSKH